MAAPIKIGELLLSQGVLTQKQLQIALEQQQVTGAILGDLLIKLGFITAPEFARTIAVQSGLEYLELSEFEPEEDALRLIPKETAEKIGVIPLALVDGHLTIGITNPSNIVAVDTATKVTGKSPDFFDAIIKNFEIESVLLKHIFNPNLQRRDGASQYAGNGIQIVIS